MEILRFVDDAQHYLKLSFPSKIFHCFGCEVFDFMRVFLKEKSGIFSRAAKYFPDFKKGKIMFPSN